MLLPHRRKISTRTLFGALFRHRHALSLCTRHFACSHGVSAASGKVIDAVNRACKFEGGLLEQCGHAVVGVRPINRR
ncbi:hypothetical protein D9M69_699020 [compost metagenome]